MAERRSESLRKKERKRCERRGEKERKIPDRRRHTERKKEREREIQTGDCEVSETESIEM